MNSLDIIIPIVCALASLSSFYKIITIERNRRETSEKVAEKEHARIVETLRQIEDSTLPPPPRITASNEDIREIKDDWQRIYTGQAQRYPITSGSVVPYSGYATSGSCAPVGFRSIYHVGGDAIYSAELIPDSAAYRYTVPDKKKSTDKVCEHCGSGNSKSRFSCSQCGAPLPLAPNE